MIRQMARRLRQVADAVRCRTILAVGYCRCAIVIAFVASHLMSRGQRRRGEWLRAVRRCGPIFDFAKHRRIAKCHEWYATAADRRLTNSQRSQWRQSSQTNLRRMDALGNSRCGCCHVADDDRIDLPRPSASAFRRIHVRRNRARPDPSRSAFSADWLIRPQNRQRLAFVTAASWTTLGSGSSFCAFARCVPRSNQVDASRYRGRSHVCLAIAAAICYFMAAYPLADSCRRRSKAEN